MDRDVHSLTLSIQHFLCWPRHHPLSNVPWKSFGEAVMVPDLPEPCWFQSFDGFPWAHTKVVDLAPHLVVGLVLQAGKRQSVGRQRRVSEVYPLNRRTKHHEKLTQTKIWPKVHCEDWAALLLWRLQPHSQQSQLAWPTLRLCNSWLHHRRVLTPLPFMYQLETDLSVSFSRLCCNQLY